jgi:hypothetical protein
MSAGLSRVPGFTAETALGRGSRTYRTTARGYGHAQSTVIPQFSRLGWPGDGCIPNCICVTEEGCPCCTSWPPSRTVRSRLIAPASCGYTYGACAGEGETVCEFTDNAGICVGSGWAPYVVNCGGHLELGEAWCGV